MFAATASPSRCITSSPTTWSSRLRRGYRSPDSRALLCLVLRNTGATCFGEKLSPLRLLDGKLVGAALAAVAGQEAKAGSPKQVAAVLGARAAALVEQTQFVAASEVYALAARTAPSPRAVALRRRGLGGPRREERRCLDWLKKLAAVKSDASRTLLLRASADPALATLRGNPEFRALVAP